MENKIECVINGVLMDLEVVGDNTSIKVGEPIPSVAIRYVLYKCSILAVQHPGRSWIECDPEEVKMIDDKTTLKLIRMVKGWEKAEFSEMMMIEGGIDEDGNERPRMWHDVIVKMPGEEGTDFYGD